MLDMDQCIVDDGWRYPIIAAVSHPASPPYIVFQVTANGATKKIKHHDWGYRLRPLNKYHRSCYPKGTGIACTTPYHPTSIQDGKEPIIL